MSHLRYDDQIPAYVNITFTDPPNGKQRTGKLLKGKWGTSGRLEQVKAPAHIAKYGGTKTDAQHILLLKRPSLIHFGYS